MTSPQACQNDVFDLQSISAPTATNLSKLGKLHQDLIISYNKI